MEPEHGLWRVHGLSGQHIPLTREGGTETHDIGFVRLGDPSMKTWVRGPKRRVIVVNDDAEFALTLTKLLVADSLEVIAVRGMNEALERLRDTEPDVILLDLHLPIMNGMEALRIILATHHRAPVITMAEAARYETALLSINAGASDFILKPFDFQYLRRLLKGAIREAGW